MRKSRWSRLLFLPLVLMVLGSSCPTDEEEEEEEPGALVGMWELTALNADYLRVIKLPADWTGATTFPLSVRWDLAPLILGDDSAKANIDVKTFVEGDVLLDSLVQLPNQAALDFLGVQLTAEFLEDNTYTLSGSYPTLRLIEEECRTTLEVPTIQDAGSYVMNYNIDETGGTLTITPSAGDQVLPPFDDAPVTFTGTDGGILGLDFLDLDAHDTQFEAAGHTWSEDLRVTMGVADLPINPAGAFDVFGSTTNDTAYIMDAALAPWGGFMTFYALTVLGETEYLALAGLITDAASDGSFVDDAIGYMAQNQTGVTQSLMPYAVLVSALGLPTDDSATDATVAGILQADGGKLKFVVNAVCIPINETIMFESTWSKL